MKILHPTYTCQKRGHTRCRKEVSRLENQKYANTTSKNGTNSTQNNTQNKKGTNNTQDRKAENSTQNKQSNMQNSCGR